VDHKRRLLDLTNGRVRSTTSTRLKRRKSCIIQAERKRKRNRATLTNEIPSKNTGGQGNRLQIFRLQPQRDEDRYKTLIVAVEAGKLTAFATGTVTPTVRITSGFTCQR
jgi:hypothetical protein